ncbi:MAG: aminopeptidase [Ruminococcaceae bacterium]|nr:aminopeptidase [Oscillospiraceae bacterium]
MKKSVLKKYAGLIVKKGVAVQKGQEVLVVAELDQPDFVAMVVEAAYKAGAAKVTVDWHHQPLEKIHVRGRSLKVMSTVEAWEVAKLERRAEVLPCMIYLMSEDPDGLKGINFKKMAKSAQARMKILKPIRDTMENKYQWVIAAVPGKAWAKKLFPEMRASQAVERLWQYILKAARADGDDPIAAWDAHNADLAARCRYMNSLGLTEVEITSSNGTNIKIGLIENSVFMGGAEAALGSGIVYNPNMPSEECFITPKKGAAEGIVYSSKPFSYNGQVIDRFRVRFENGKAVEIQAEDERQTEILKQMIAMDEGAAYLGEVALVPFSSPVNRTGILFFNTLFDENAACHLALGRGFSNCLVDYEKYSHEETKALGINDSMIHEDFMIGTADTAIVGITKDGRRIPLFQNGEWAF